MSSKKKNGDDENFDENIEYQFEDDSQSATDNYDASTEEVSGDTDMPADAEVTESVNADESPVMATPKTPSKYKKPLILVFGALLLTGAIFFLLGGNIKHTPPEAQFVLGSEKSPGTAASPFASEATNTSTTQEDFLAELDTKTAGKAAPVNAAEKSPIKKAAMEHALPTINQEQVDKEVHTAVQAAQRESQQQLNEAMITLNNQHKQSMAELQKRYDSALLQANRKITQLEQENTGTLTEIKTLTARFMEEKEQMAILRKQMEISFNNQKRIMYNQGMSFDASGAAITRINDDEVPMATIIQDTVKNNITYNVQAVVPGRAWLMSSTGTSFSVAIGDKVEGLGVVVDIDALNGIVATSSGKLLTTH